MSIHSNPTSPQFKENAHAALADPQLQQAMANLCASASRVAAARRSRNLPEFEALRDSARDIKNHTLAHLDLYLEAYEQKVTSRPAATCITPAMPPKRARSCSIICARPRRQDGH